MSYRYGNNLCFVFHKLSLSHKDKSNHHNPCLLLSYFLHQGALFRYAQLTITLKMADQGRSNLYVVFTMILCGLNFSVWYVMKLIFTD